MPTKFKLLLVLSLSFFIYFLFINPPLKLEGIYYKNYLINNNYICDNGDSLGGEQFLVGDCYIKTKLNVPQLNEDLEIFLSISFEEGYPIFNVNIKHDEKVTGFVDYIYYMPLDDYSSRLTCRFYNDDSVNDNCYDIYKTIKNNNVLLNEDILFFYNSIIKFYPQYKITTELLSKSTSMTSN